MNSADQNATVSKSNFNQQFDHHFIQRAQFLIRFSTYKAVHLHMHYASYVGNESLILVEIPGQMECVQCAKTFHIQIDACRCNAYCNRSDLIKKSHE